LIFIRQIPMNAECRMQNAEQKKNPSEFFILHSAFCIPLPANWNRQLAT